MFISAAALSKLQRTGAGKTGGNNAAPAAAANEGESHSSFLNQLFGSGQRRLMAVAVGADGSAASAGLVEVSAEPAADTAPKAVRASGGGVEASVPASPKAKPAAAAADASAQTSKLSAIAEAASALVGARGEASSSSSGKPAAAAGPSAGSEASASGESKASSSSAASKASGEEAVKDKAAPASPAAASPPVDESDEESDDLQGALEVSGNQIRTYVCTMQSSHSPINMDVQAAQVRPALPVLAQSLGTHGWRCASAEELSLFCRLWRHGVARAGQLVQQRREA